MNRHRRFRFLCTLPVLLLFIAGGVAACSATNVSSGPTAAKCQVTVGALGPVVASGGTASVPVTAPQECGWDATTPATWITGLAPSSGQGTAMLEFQVAPNPAPIAREADVLINQERVHVSQDAAPCVYSVAPNDQTIPAAGGAGTINVTTLTGCSWNGVADVGWITITGAASGSGNGTIRFSAAPNGGAQRDGTVTIAGQVATISQSASVTSAPGPSPSPSPSPSPNPSPSPSPSPNPNPSPSPSPSPSPGPAPSPTCTTAITPTTYAASAGGGAGPTVSVSAASGCTWTAASNDAWITVTSGASGNGNGSVAFSMASNPSNARSGSLTIAGQTFSVQQASCGYAITPTSYAASAGGGAGPTVSVSAASGCTWTATSNASWLTIASGAIGNGNGSVTFSVASNPSNARGGSLTIAGRTLSVQQAACTYAVTPTTYAASPGGGAGPTVSVSAENGCAWTASSNDSWISIASGASGNGNGSVAFSVESNPFNIRSGSLTIARQTFSVQQATSCVFTPSRDTISVPTDPRAGVTRTVRVTTSGPLCNWTASTPDSWITIVTGSNYVGTQDVDIAATANTTGIKRTGTLLVAGQAVTVEQQP